MASPSLRSSVHLGNLLVERAAVQLDAERIHDYRCRVLEPAGDALPAGSWRPFEHESLSRS